ncbi:SDR family oxidoreductase [Ornithinimicrobium sufpigmenti]|uniref:SDR family oxidoreductase n=1 Tax=Ornithinimicrobium sufpigmenti TaxID=2508882 RepID=UPI0010365E27|nr:MULTISPECIES: SDR family oxidoreductase [unclassified Ornithinimicrobium]
MDLGLAGRAYLVTGASRGLGHATARALVRDGAHVVITGRDQASVTEAARALSELGPGRALGVAADQADPDAAAELLARTRAEFGRVDGVVISVGGPPAGSATTVTDDQWRAAFESVFLGAVRLARTALVEATDPIAVTLVLSSSVRSPLSGLAISNGLRPGLAMTAKTLADEHGPDGHRVNVVLPGRIETDRLRALDATADDPQEARRRSEATIPLRRYGRPDEFGAVTAFVTSPAASYMTGSVLTVDGGAVRSL